MDRTMTKKQFKDTFEISRPVSYGLYIEKIIQPSLGSHWDAWNKHLMVKQIYRYHQWISEPLTNDDIQNVFDLDDKEMTALILTPAGSGIVSLIVDVGKGIKEKVITRNDLIRACEKHNITLELKN